MCGGRRKPSHPEESFKCKERTKHMKVKNHKELSATKYISLKVLNVKKEQNTVADVWQKKEPSYPEPIPMPKLIAGINRPQSNW